MTQLAGWRAYYADGSGAHPLDWKLWYLDESTYSSADGPWDEAPARGVAGLVYPSEKVGRCIDTGDFYLWPPWIDTPYGADAWGLMDYLLEAGALDPDQPLTAVPFATLKRLGVKLGRSVSNAEWERIHVAMTEDPDFPMKSAHRRQERRP